MDLSNRTLHATVRLMQSHATTILRAGLIEEEKRDAVSSPR